MPEFENYLEQRIEALEAGQSGASVSPIATEFTTETVPNPAGDGDMTVLVLAANSPLLAVKVEGDDFPRLFWLIDDGLYMGDGTFDAYQSGSFIGVGGNIDIGAYGTNKVGIHTDAEGAITLSAGELGFFGTSSTAKPTGVAVTAEAIHAALVTLGLISA